MTFINLSSIIEQYNNSILSTNLCGSILNERNKKNIIYSLLNTSLEEFSKTNEIKLLDLSNNLINDTFMIDILDILFENKHLETLILNNNCISDKGFQYMELFLKKNTLLKTISIASNKIGIDTIKILSDLINSNRNLTSINLNNCSIDRNGCKILFNSISQTNSSLVYLNLGKNILNIKSIVSCLELNTSLVYLNLSDTMKFNSNFIVSKIAKALEKNKTLRELDLSMNYITTNGAKSIGRMLLVNRTLTDIHLNNNRIDSIKWLDTLKINRTLNTLNIKDNCISVDKLLLLASSLRDSNCAIEINCYEEDKHDSVYISGSNNIMVSYV